MRARSRSYGDSSTRTRSPGRILIRKRRILPATWPSTTRSMLSSLTRNIAFGRASTTSPSSSTFSSFGIAAILVSCRRHPVGACVYRPPIPAPPLAGGGVFAPAAPGVGVLAGVVGVAAGVVAGGVIAGVVAGDVPAAAPPLVDVDDVAVYGDV